MRLLVSGLLGAGETGAELSRRINRPLDLAYNYSSDLGPLVANPGLGAGDVVSLTYNRLDCEAQAANLGTLRARGVTVSSDCD